MDTRVGPGKSIGVDLRVGSGKSIGVVCGGTSIGTSLRGGMGMSIGMSVDLAMRAGAGIGAASGHSSTTNGAPLAGMKPTGT